MKRDMDLCRRILLALEEAAVESELPEFEGVPDEVVHYHLNLLREAGLIEAIVESEIQDYGLAMVVPIRITWNGHEFLDASRDDSLWAAAKDKSLAAGGAVSFGVLLELLKQLMRDQLGL